MTGQVVCAASSQAYPFLSYNYIGPWLPVPLRILCIDFHLKWW